MELFKVIDPSQVDIIQNSIEYVLKDNELQGYNALGLDFLPVIVRNGKACVLNRDLLIEKAEMEMGYKND